MLFLFCDQFILLSFISFYILLSSTLLYISIRNLFCNYRLIISHFLRILIYSRSVSFTHTMLNTTAKNSIRRAREQYARAELRLMQRLRHEIYSVNGLTTVDCSLKLPSNTLPEIVPLHELFMTARRELYR